jgi:hypothetical protein
MLSFASPLRDVQAISGTLIKTKIPQFSPQPSQFMILQLNEFKGYTQCPQKVKKTIQTKTTANWNFAAGRQCYI